MSVQRRFPLRPVRAIVALVAGALVLAAVGLTGPAYAATWSGTVTIAANPTTTNINAPSSTLTATVSANLIAGYSVSIWDVSGTRVYCSTTTTTRTFTIGVSSASDTTATYRAYVATSCGSGSTPPSPYAARSATVNVVNSGWTGTITGFTASPATVDVTNPGTTLSVTTSKTVLSPYWVSIYDNMGYRYICTNSTTLTTFQVGASGIPVNGSLTFTAYISSQACSTNPPTTGIRQTKTVTVSNAGWTGAVSLTATPATTDANNPGTTVKATFSKPVVAPYWVSIFDQTGARQACAQPGVSASTYSVDLATPNKSTTTYTAYVAQGCGTMTTPPTAANDIRSQASTVVTNAGWTGSVLLTGPTSLVDAFNSGVTLTGTVSKTLQGPYYYSLFDDTGARQTCARDVTALTYPWPVGVPNDTRRVFTAYVAGDCGTTTSPPTNDVRSTSSFVVTNEGWNGAVDVTANPAIVSASHPGSSLSVTLSKSLVAPYSVALYGPNNTLITCLGGTVSSLPDTNVNVDIGQTYKYQALVTRSCGVTGAPPAPNLVDASNETTVRNIGWDGRMTFVANGPGPTYSLNVSLDLGLVAPYQISIWDETGQQLTCSNTTTSTAGVSVTPSAGSSHTYTAYVAAGCGTTAPPTTDVKAMQGVSISGGVSSALVDGLALPAVAARLAQQEAILGREAVCAELAATPIGTHTQSSVTNEGLAIGPICMSGQSWLAILTVAAAAGTAGGYSAWLAYVNSHNGPVVVVPPAPPCSPGPPPNCTPPTPAVTSTPGVDTSPDSDYVESLAVDIYERSVDVVTMTEVRIAARQCLQQKNYAIAMGVTFPGGIIDPCKQMNIFMPGFETGNAGVETLKAAQGHPWNEYASSNVHIFSALTGWPYPDGTMSPKAPHPQWYFLNFRSRGKNPSPEGWYYQSGYSGPCDARAALSPAQRSSIECDEFPFRATLQGSAAASSTRPIQDWSNRVGGSAYSRFVSQCLGGWNVADASNAPFFIVPLVGPASPLSMHVCANPRR